MERTQVYIPKKLKLEVKQVSRKNGESVSDFIRQALQDRLSLLRHSKKDGLRAFLNMAVGAEQNRSSGITDAALNHDAYLYGRRNAK